MFLSEKSIGLLFALSVKSGDLFMRSPLTMKIRVLLVFTFYIALLSAVLFIDNVKTAKNQVIIQFYLVLAMLYNRVRVATCCNNREGLSIFLVEAVYHTVKHGSVSVNSA
jgi:hypothetical protein